MKLNFDTRGPLTQAIAFTTHIHGAYEDGGRMLPALMHCLETADIVSTLTEDTDTKVAALLHDIPERFPEKQPLIMRCFGAEIASLTVLEQYPKSLQPDDRNWQRRKLFVISRLANDDPRRRLIFLADKLSEVRYLAANDYNTLRVKKNMSLMTWYYQSVLVALGDLSRTAAYREMNDRVKGMTMVQDP